MEAWIEKIQEMFNKDIKELKNSDQQQDKGNEKYTGKNQ